MSFTASQCSSPPKSPRVPSSFRPSSKEDLKSVFDHLVKDGFHNIVDYFDFNFWNPSYFPIPFNDSNYLKIASNMPRLDSLYHRFDDELSRKTFLSILDARINFNFRKQDFNYALENQYFEDFIDTEKIKAFVDAGGYDGTTTLKAMELFGNLEKVFYFEPSSESMLISKARLKAASKCHIEFMETALSGENTTKFITSDKGGANYIANEGKLKVNVSTLDSLIHEKVDYFRLDIEGEGAERPERLCTEY